MLFLFYDVSFCIFGSINMKLFFEIHPSLQSQNQNLLNRKIIQRNMKPFLSILIFIAILSSASAQIIQCTDLTKIDNITYKAGKAFTGRCLTYYPNGNKKYSCEFFQGLKEGKEESYYESGPVKTKAIYCEGNMHGDCSYTYFLEDGQEKSVISFDMGKKTDIIQYAPYYLYPVIVGEENGTIKRSLLANKDQIEVKLLKTYYKYFDDKGNFDPQYTLKVTDDLRFVFKGDINFVKYRMTCELPIWPPRETIYDHIDFNGQANAPYMSDSMRDNFRNMKLAKFTLTELVLYRRDNLKNYMWIIPGREIIIID